MRKVLAAFLIIVGISVMFYPTMNNLYSSYMQEKMIAEWEGSSEEAARNLMTLNEVFSKSEEGVSVLSSNVSAAAPKKSKSMMGTIEIERIDVKLPILEGATQKNLKIGAGHLKGTSLPGEVGNVAIAAHRSRSFGKMFNRLGEVKVGDKIILKNQDETFEYEVFEIEIVKPTNVKVLEASGAQKTLTLITCDPVDTATHRLIIKAKL